MLSSTTLKKLIFFTVLVTLSFALLYRKEVVGSLIELEMYMRSMPLLGGLVLVVIKIVSALIGLPGTPFTLLAGSLFGKIYGMFIALVGNILGATAAFLLSRFLFREYVIRSLFKKYPKIKQYDDRLNANAIPTMVALRLIPLFPFNVLNFMLGATSVSLRDYIIATSVGIIPGTFVFVYFGESLRMLNPIGITIAVLGLISLIVIGKQYEKRY